MRTTTATKVMAAGAALAGLLALSGCSMLGGPEDPKRDEDSGEIVEASESDAFALRIGDCMNYGESEETEVETVATVPCAEPHDTEVYAATYYEGDEFPGMDALETRADEYCAAEFTGFVGTDPAVSEIFYSYFTPTEASWDQIDDREILCMVVDLEGGVTGTMGGSNR